MGFFLTLFIALFSYSASADCHYVSRDGKQWTSEREFCFDATDRLSVKIVEKGKELYQGNYSLEKLTCEAGDPKCDQVNVRATNLGTFSDPAEWPEFAVLQWLPANYGFDLHYRETGSVVTGLLDVYDTDIAKFMTFCSVDPTSPAGKDCRSTIPEEH